MSNDNEIYVIVNTTHNTYLTQDAVNGNMHFQQNKKIAYKYKGKQFAQFCADTYEEQHPQFNFKIEEVNNAME